MIGKRLCAFFTLNQIRIGLFCLCIIKSILISDRSPADFFVNLIIWIDHSKNHRSKIKIWRIYFFITLFIELSDHAIRGLVILSCYKTYFGIIASKQAGDPSFFFSRSCISIFCRFDRIPSRGLEPSGTAKVDCLIDIRVRWKINSLSVIYIPKCKMPAFHFGNPLGCPRFHKLKFHIDPVNTHNRKCNI